MKLGNVILILFILNSCQNKKREIRFSKFKEFILADTSIKANRFLTKAYASSDYPIYYIGKATDTIGINRQLWKGRNAWNYDFSTIPSRNFSKTTLVVFVDTSTKTNAAYEYHSEDPNVERDSTINYNAFPLILENISDSVINMGFTYSLFYMHEEVKNRNGDWVKLAPSLNELALFLTHEPYILLYRHQVIISKVRRFKGDFITDFRLCFCKNNSKVYSNIFRDSIDEQILRDPRVE